jgi:hypothetical protein
MSRFVVTLESWKAGNRMTELKFGIFLSRPRLTEVDCAEKIGSDPTVRAFGVRLFKV